VHRPGTTLRGECGAQRPASATLGCGLLEDNSRRYCPHEILPPALSWRSTSGDTRPLVVSRGLVRRLSKITHSLVTSAYVRSGGP
jgi:hypothetical protein